MGNSEYIRGYKKAHEMMENMSDDKADWLPQRIKELARNQDPMNAYDHGSYDAVVDFQHQQNWKY